MAQGFDLDAFYGGLGQESQPTQSGYTPEKEKEGGFWSATGDAVEAGWEGAQANVHGFFKDIGERQGDAESSNYANARMKQRADRAREISKDFNMAQNLVSGAVESVPEIIGTAGSAVLTRGRSVAPHLVGAGTSYASTRGGMERELYERQQDAEARGEQFVVPEDFKERADKAAAISTGIGASLGFLPGGKAPFRKAAQALFEDSGSSAASHAATQYSVDDDITKGIGEAALYGAAGGAAIRGAGKAVDIGNRVYKGEIKPDQILSEAMGGFTNTVDSLKKGGAEPTSDFQSDIRNRAGESALERENILNSTNESDLAKNIEAHNDNVLNKNASKAFADATALLSDNGYMHARNAFDLEYTDSSGKERNFMDDLGVTGWGVDRAAKRIDKASATFFRNRAAKDAYETGESFNERNKEIANKQIFKAQNHLGKENQGIVKKLRRDLQARYVNPTPAQKKRLEDLKTLEGEYGALIGDIREILSFNTQDITPAIRDRVNEIEKLAIKTGVYDQLTNIRGEAGPKTELLSDIQTLSMMMRQAKRQDKNFVYSTYDSDTESPKGRAHTGVGAAIGMYGGLPGLIAKTGANLSTAGLRNYLSQLALRREKNKAREIVQGLARGESATKPKGTPAAPVDITPLDEVSHNAGEEALASGDLSAATENFQQALEDTGVNVEPTPEPSVVQGPSLGTRKPAASSKTEIPSPTESPKLSPDQEAIRAATAEVDWAAQQLEEAIAAYAPEHIITRLEKRLDDAITKRDSLTAQSETGAPTSFQNVSEPTPQSQEQSVEEDVIPPEESFVEPTTEEAPQGSEYMEPSDLRDLARMNQSRMTPEPEPTPEPEDYMSNEDITNLASQTSQADPALAKQDMLKRNRDFEKARQEQLQAEEDVRKLQEEIAEKEAAEKEALDAIDDAITETIEQENKVEKAKHAMAKRMAESKNRPTADGEKASPAEMDKAIADAMEVVEELIPSQPRARDSKIHPGARQEPKLDLENKSYQRADIDSLEEVSEVSLGDIDSLDIESKLDSFNLGQSVSKQALAAEIRKLNSDLAKAQDNVESKKAEAAEASRLLEEARELAAERAREFSKRPEDYNSQKEFDQAVADDSVSQQDLAAEVDAEVERSYQEDQEMKKAAAQNKAKEMAKPLSKEEQEEANYQAALEANATARVEEDAAMAAQVEADKVAAEKRAQDYAVMRGEPTQPTAKTPKTPTEEELRQKRIEVEIDKEEARKAREEADFAKSEAEKTPTNAITSREMADAGAILDRAKKRAEELEAAALDAEAKASQSEAELTEMVQEESPVEQSPRGSDGLSGAEPLSSLREKRQKEIEDKQQELSSLEEEAKVAQDTADTANEELSQVQEQVTQSPDMAGQEPLLKMAEQRAAKAAEEAEKAIKAAEESRKQLDELEQQPVEEIQEPSRGSDGLSGQEPLETLRRKQEEAVEPVSDVANQVQDDASDGPIPETSKIEEEIKKLEMLPISARSRVTEEIDPVTNEPIETTPEMKLQTLTTELREQKRLASELGVTQPALEKLLSDNNLTAKGSSKTDIKKALQAKTDASKEEGKLKLREALREQSKQWKADDLADTIAEKKKISDEWSQEAGVSPEVLREAIIESGFHPEGDYNVPKVHALALEKQAAVDNGETSIPKDHVLKTDAQSELEDYLTYLEVPESGEFRDAARSFYDSQMGSVQRESMPLNKLDKLIKDVKGFVDKYRQEKPKSAGEKAQEALDSNKEMWDSWVSDLELTDDEVKESLFKAKLRAGEPITAKGLRDLRDASYEVVNSRPSAEDSDIPVTHVSREDFISELDSALESVPEDKRSSLKAELLGSKSNTSYPIKDVNKALGRVASESYKASLPSKKDLSEAAIAQKVSKMESWKERQKIPDDIYNNVMNLYEDSDFSLPAVKKEIMKELEESTRPEEIPVSVGYSASDAKTNLTSLAEKYGVDTGMVEAKLSKYPEGGEIPYKEYGAIVESMYNTAQKDSKARLAKEEKAANEATKEYETLQNEFNSLKTQKLSSEALQSAKDRVDLAKERSIKLTKEYKNSLDELSKSMQNDIDKLRESEENAAAESAKAKEVNDSIESLSKQREKYEQIALQEEDIRSVLDKYKGEDPWSLSDVDIDEYLDSKFSRMDTPYTGSAWTRQRELANKFAEGLTSSRKKESEDAANKAASESAKKLVAQAQERAKAQELQQQKIQAIADASNQQSTIRRILGRFDLTPDQVESFMDVNLPGPTTALSPKDYSKVQKEAQSYGEGINQDSENRAQEAAQRLIDKANKVSSEKAQALEEANKKLRNLKLLGEQQEKIETLLGKAQVPQSFIDSYVHRRFSQKKEPFKEETAWVSEYDKASRIADRWKEQNNIQKESMKRALDQMTPEEAAGALESLLVDMKDATEGGLEQLQEMVKNLREYTESREELSSSISPNHREVASTIEDVLDNVTKMKAKYPTRPEFWITRDELNRIKSSYKGDKYLGSHVGSVWKDLRAAIFGDDGGRVFLADWKRKELMKSGKPVNPSDMSEVDMSSEDNVGVDISSGFTIR